MSVLNSKDLHTPLSGATIQKVKGIICGEKSHQAAAADLTATFIATQGGKLLDCYIVLATAFAAAVENMTVDIQVNGVSIMPSATPQTFDASTDVGTQVKIVTEATQIAVGDVIAIIRDWTTGGGGLDTTPANVIGIEWADRNEA